MKRVSVRSVAERLRTAGLRCRLARRGSQFGAEGEDGFTLRADAAEDWKQLMEVCSERSPSERVVYLWTLDEPSETDPVLMGTGRFTAIDASNRTYQTDGETPYRYGHARRAAGRSRYELPMPAQAPAIGLLRVMCSEHPNFVCRAVDLPPLASPEDETLLWDELMQSDAEREIAFRGEARYVRRLARGRPQRGAMARLRSALTTGLARTGASRHPAFCSLPDAILRASAGVD